MNKNKVMDFFSALGRSLLMPIAALAACGIGSSVCNFNFE